MSITVTVELPVGAVNSVLAMLQCIKKVLLEVEVRCSSKECASTRIREKSSSIPSEEAPTSFECLDCGVQFTWDESGFFTTGRQHVWTELVEACICEGRTETAVAKEIGVPQCHISRLITTATQEIARYEPQLKQLVHQQASNSLATQGLNPIVETDETFISAQRQTFFPTWTVDQRGELIHFDWLETRSDEHLTQYLADQREVAGPGAIQVHDGYAGYHRWARQDPSEQFEIIHIHRHPKGRVLVVGHERMPECACATRHILGLHTRSLHGPTPPIGYYAVQITRCENHACQCRPDLCLEDDHLYLCGPCQTHASQIQQEHRWQLNHPQEVYTKGILVSWDRPPAIGALPFLHSENLARLSGPFNVWCSSWIQALLGLMYQKFPRCCPTTNRIERQHARFKDHLEWRGCRKPKHVKAWFFSWIAQTYFPDWVRRLLARITRRINPRVILWALLKHLFPYLTIDLNNYEKLEQMRRELETA